MQKGWGSPTGLAQAKQGPSQLPLWTDGMWQVMEASRGCWQPSKMLVRRMRTTRTQTMQAGYVLLTALPETHQAHS